MPDTALYFVRLHGDHGFTPSGSGYATLELACIAASVALERNLYFRGATIIHQKHEVMRVPRETRPDNA